MSNANEPAYPILLHEGEELPGGVEPSGMTKREHFAATAMQGILSGVLSTLTDVEWAQVSRDSVRAADALLAELEKQS